MNIYDLRKLINKEQIVWRNHILVRMRQRNIKIFDVLNCIISGEVIEEYENDYPYPSVLVLGKALNGSYLHVVCALGQEKVWMITVYYPNKDEWINGFRTRRESNG